MSNFNFQLHLVHRCNTGDFNIDIWLEVSRVLFVSDEGLHLVPEKLNILEGSTKINVDRKLFTHSIGSRNVLDPHGIEHDVWDLR